jgi:hypothetical protein
MRNLYPLLPKRTIKTKEFVGTTLEAYCQWMCDMEEYIQGKGIVTPAATTMSSQ